jgi:hypothetical protein
MSSAYKDFKGDLLSDLLFLLLEFLTLVVNKNSKFKLLSLWIP